tara:strand:- start:1367 stop:1510 length:144 start_codon:yes stop_codon:yes gene_type:complete
MESVEDEELKQLIMMFFKKIMMRYNKLNNENIMLKQQLEKYKTSNTL